MDAEPDCIEKLARLTPDEDTYSPQHNIIRISKGTYDPHNPNDCRALTVKPMCQTAPILLGMLVHSVRS